MNVSIQYMNCSPQSSFIASVAFDQIRKLPQLFMKIDLNLYVFIRLIEMNWFILAHESKIIKKEPSSKVPSSHQVSILKSIKTLTYKKSVFWEITINPKLL